MTTKISLFLSLHLLQAFSASSFALIEPLGGPFSKAFAAKASVALAAVRRGRRRPKQAEKPSESSGDGFQKSPLPLPNPVDAPGEADGKSIYSLPALYDLAFGYRDYEEEADFLISRHQYLHEGSPPRRVLELAAGPARHSVEALRTNMIESVTALDLSHEMKEYACSIAEETLEEGHTKEGFHYVVDDMRSFDVSSQNKFDSAWILLGSLQHMTTNEEAIQCFQSIHRALNEKGTLIIELPHPRESFALGECTRNSWKVPLEDDEQNEYGRLEIIWGDDDDTFDPIAQVRQFTVDMRLAGIEDTEKAASLQSIRQIVPMRIYTSQEIDALARLSGFAVVEQYGALDPEVTVHDGDEAYRLVCVLQKQ